MSVGIAVDVSNICLRQGFFDSETPVHSVAQETGLPEDTTVLFKKVVPGKSFTRKDWVFQILGTNDALVVHTQGLVIGELAFQDTAEVVSDYFDGQDVSDITMESSIGYGYGYFCDPEKFFRALAKKGVDIERWDRETFDVAGRLKKKEYIAFFEDELFLSEK